MCTFVHGWPVAQGWQSAPAPAESCSAEPQRTGTFPAGGSGVVSAWLGVLIMAWLLMTVVLGVPLPSDGLGRVGDPDGLHCHVA